MFTIDPRDSSGATALVATQSEAFNDQVVTFDLVREEIAAQPAFDFQPTGTPCGVRSVLAIREQDLGALPRGDELWFTCRDHVEIVANNDVARAEVPRAVKSAALSRLLVYPNGTTIGRVVVAERGGDTVTVVRLSSSDQDPGARPTETVIDGTTFGSIGGLFVLAVGDAQLGDVLLVFDRSPAPRLVPIQREHGAVVWHGAPLAHASSLVTTLDLDADVDAVELLENLPPDLTTLSVVGNAPNLITVANMRSGATHGGVSFFRYEAELKHETSAPFQELSLGFSAPHAGPSDAMLFAEEQDTTMKPNILYAPSTADVVTIFSVPASQADAPLELNIRGTLDRTTLPNGLVVGPGLANFWISHAGSVVLSKPFTFAVPQ